ncbi:MAG: accessory gene regulator B family protein [Clostridiales bacterium]|jgi:accessory gene regulator B|nr:accessory gene regulator B family protein [Clostridiales bacterium]
MKSRVDERVVESLISLGVVPSEDKDIYVYGVGQGIVLLVNLISVIIIGLLLGMVWQSLVFILAYIPIRSYAGGYHASTQLRCYILSNAVVVAVLIAIRLVPWNGYACLSVTIFSIITIILLAPVEDLNKPLREIEIKVFRKLTRIILVILLVIALILWYFAKQFSICVIIALLVVAIMLILGVIKNVRCKHTDNG